MEKLEIDVFKISQPMGDFYIGKVSAKDLLNISYADRMRFDDGKSNISSYLGIQRTLKKSRIRDIKKYVKTQKATFPTSIILSIDEAFVDEEALKNNRLIIKEATLEEKKLLIEDDFVSRSELNIKNVAKILDGQHRLAGLDSAIREVEEKKHSLFGADYKFLLKELRNFELSIMICIGYDLAEQARIFATVNLAQTRVNKDLVYNLEEYSKKKTPQKVCHNIAKKLDENKNSPFYHRIKMFGHKTPERKECETLGQAVFVESLLKLISKDLEKERDLMEENSWFKAKNEGYTKNELDSKYIFHKILKEKMYGQLLDIIWNYFDAIKETWPKAWEDREKSLISKNNCFRGFMRYLRDIYPNMNEHNIIGYTPSKEDFKNIFKKYDIKDSEFIIKFFDPSNIGLSKFYKYLSGQLDMKEIKDDKN